MDIQRKIKKLVFKKDEAFVTMSAATNNEDDNRETKRRNKKKGQKNMNSLNTKYVTYNVIRSCCNMKKIFTAGNERSRFLLSSLDKNISHR